MDSKYFGILNPTELVSLNIKQMDEYLFDKDLMVKSYGGSMMMSPTDDIGAMKSKIEISEKILKYRYSDELANTVFEFLLEHYKAGVGGDKGLFNRGFDDETFGLSKLERKVKGLDYFNKYFELVKGDIQIGLEYNSEREIVAEKRFKTLFRIRESFKYQLQEPNNLVLGYLLGHLDYFNKKFFESTPFLVKMFKFENILSILISLNKNFKFEKDDVFTKKSIAQVICENHEKEFHSLKQVRFIEYQLDNQINRNHAFVVSLFFFFKKTLNLKCVQQIYFKK